MKIKTIKSFQQCWKQGYKIVDERKVQWMEKDFFDFEYAVVQGFVFVFEEGAEEIEFLIRSDL